MEQVPVIVWAALCLAAAAAAAGPPRHRPPLSYDVVEESPAGTVVTPTSPRCGVLPHAPRQFLDVTSEFWTTRQLNNITSQF